MNNMELRSSAKKHQVRHWQIARELGISEFSFSRKLRDDLSTEEKNKILDIIERLGEQYQHES